MRWTHPATTSGFLFFVVLMVPLLLSVAQGGPQDETEERASGGGTASIRLLGVNDFHGHLEPSGSVNGRMAGGAAHLAAYLEHYERPGATVRVHAGDMVGASPMISGYFHDEPTVRAMNRMDFDVGTVGNHEFDEGVEEMLRLINGGHRSDGRQFKGGRDTSELDFPGADFPFLAANTVWSDSGEPVLPPYRILERDGVRIGFIGVATPETEEIIHPGFAAPLRFLDMSATVNRYAADLRREGVETIVVLAHSGGASLGPGEAGGEVISETAQMDGSVDVVVAGHTHNRLNTRVEGKLVVEAGAYGTAFGVVDLDVDRLSGEVLGSEAGIVTTYNDTLQPDTGLKALVDRYEAKVRSFSERVVGTSVGDITGLGTESGESALGDLVADAWRSFSNADFAFVPAGSLRASISAGPVTYGELYATQPFGDRLVKMELSGDQVYRILEQQYTRKRTRTLQVSGLRYSYDPSRTFGNRVTGVELPDGSPLDRSSTYTVAVNGFLAAGGGGFTVLRGGENRRDLGENLRALEVHLQNLPQPFSAPNPVTEARITKEIR